MNIEELHKKASPVLSSYGVKKAALFGSHARNDHSDQSDIDIVVELGRKMSLLDFAGLKIDLEDALHKKVDLVQYKHIKPAIKEYIVREASIFYTS